MFQIIATVILTIVSFAALGIVGYFAYRYGHSKGYGTGHDAGYKEAQEQQPQPQLSPEQAEVKQNRERFEDHFSKLFSYKAPSKKVTKWKNKT